MLEANSVEMAHFSSSSPSGIFSRLVSAAGSQHGDSQVSSATEQHSRQQETRQMVQAPWTLACSGIQKRRRHVVGQRHGRMLTEHHPGVLSLAALPAAAASYTSASGICHAFQNSTRLQKRT